MKRFTILAVAAAIVLTIAMSVYEREDRLTIPQKLERAMRQTVMQTYRDSLYDYTVRYPAFFEPSAEAEPTGSCRFTFWIDSVQIVQTVFVEPNPDSLSTSDAMTHYADMLHATERWADADSFILAGPLHAGGAVVSGHRFYAKFVRHRKLWFVQSLTYPEDCAAAIAPLLGEIRRWQVWE